MQCMRHKLSRTGMILLLLLRIYVQVKFGCTFYNYKLLMLYSRLHSMIQVRCILRFYRLNVQARSQQRGFVGQSWRGAKLRLIGQQFYNLSSNKMNCCLSVSSSTPVRVQGQPRENTQATCLSNGTWVRTPALRVSRSRKYLILILDVVLTPGLIKSHLWMQHTTTIWIL